MGAGAGAGAGAEYVLSHGVVGVVSREERGAARGPGAGAGEGIWLGRFLAWCVCGWGGVVERAGAVQP